MIHIFDSMIKDSLTLLQHQLNQEELKELEMTSPMDSKVTGDMILRSDMAYELGGSNLPALSGILYTSNSFTTINEDSKSESKGIEKNKDGIYLLGPDLQEIKEDVPYARLTLIGLESSKINEDQDGYDRMKQIEYTRYRTNLSGFMMRISSSKEREMVRVSKEALKEGLDFNKVGSSLIAGYKKHTGVLWVKIFFITTNEFNYNSLEHQVMLANGVMESMNEIFKHVQMDCGSCGLRQVCDEVEGLRELHFAQTSLT